MHPLYRPVSMVLLSGNRRTKDSKQKARDGPTQSTALVTPGDAEHILSNCLSYTFSALGMPFLQMLPVTFPSKITEIICDQQAKGNRGIHQNETKVKRKEETQMSMGLMLLFLSEETEPDNGEIHGALSLFIVLAAFF